MVPLPDVSVGEEVKKPSFVGEGDSHEDATDVWGGDEAPDVVQGDGPVLDGERHDKDHHDPGRASVLGGRLGGFPALIILGLERTNEG